MESDIDITGGGSPLYNRNSEQSGSDARTSSSRFSGFKEKVVRVAFSILSKAPNGLFYPVPVANLDASAVSMKRQRRKHQPRGNPPKLSKWERDALEAANSLDMMKYTKLEAEIHDMIKDQSSDWDSREAEESIDRLFALLRRTRYNWIRTEVVALFLEIAQSSKFANMLNMVSERFINLLNEDHIPTIDENMEALLTLLMTHEELEETLREKIRWELTGGKEGGFFPSKRERIGVNKEKQEVD